MLQSMELDVDAAKITKAKQKLRYANELVLEAVSDLIDSMTLNTQLEVSQSHVVAVSENKTKQDLLFILAFHASKLDKEDFAFMLSCLEDIEREKTKTSASIVQLKHGP